MGEGLYASNISARTYEELVTRARHYLEAGRTVILDATFALEKSRKPVARLARKLGVGLLTINCTCPQGVALKRIVGRQKEFDFSDATPEVYHHVRNHFDRVYRSHNLVTIDTTDSIPPSIKKIEVALLRI